MEESQDQTQETKLQICNNHDNVGLIKIPKYQRNLTWFRTVPRTETFNDLPTILWWLPMSIELDFTTFKQFRTMKP